MSNIIIRPSQLSGAVFAPPSKSDVHRAVICAALSGGGCRVAPVALSNDIRATLNCIEALGAVYELNGNVLRIDGRNLFENKKAVMDCGESGSTLRFFIPIAAAGGVSAVFTGKGRLPQRPIGIYLDCLPKAGVKCVTEKGLPLSIEGRLKSGELRVPGNVSSQFITGLLLALPLLEGDSRIVLTAPLESSGYIDMTLSCMKKFGVTVDETDCGWFVRGGQRYIPSDYDTDGDWSQAAFFMAAGAVSGDVEVKGVHPDSTQGDRRIADILKRMGADIEIGNDSVRVKKSKLHSVDIDGGEIPDLVPILAVLSSFAEGTTEIFNAGRLRIKESDRLKTTADMLNSLGGCVEERRDGLIIRGVKRLKGGKVNGANDHRIVMAASVAALFSEKETEITDRESVNKSFPDYFEEYKRLGGKY